MLNLLNSIVENTMEDSLKHEVAEIIISEAGESNEEIAAYLDNVLSYGCVSGTVCNLIYYSDTELFFDRHADEIFDLYNEAKAELGELDIELNKNNLAWFGFETIAYEIREELEMANEF